MQLRGRFKKSFNAGKNLRDNPVHSLLHGKRCRYIEKDAGNKHFIESLLCPRKVLCCNRFFNEFSKWITLYPFVYTRKSKLRKLEKFANSLI